MDSLCRLGWPQIHGSPPASPSRVSEIIGVHYHSLQKHLCEAALDKKRVTSQAQTTKVKTNKSDFRVETLIPSKGNSGMKRETREWERRLRRCP